MTVWVNDAAQHALTMVGLSNDGQLLLADDTGHTGWDVDALITAYRPVIPGFTRPDWLSAEVGGVDAPTLPESRGTAADAARPDEPVSPPAADEATVAAEPVDEWDVEDPDPDDARFPEWIG